MAPAQSKGIGKAPKKQEHQSQFDQATIDKGNAILGQACVNDRSAGSIVLEFLDFLRELKAPWEITLMPEDLIVHPESLLCTR